MPDLRRQDVTQRLDNGDYKGLSESMPKSIARALEIGTPMLTLQRQDKLIDYIQDELVILASQVNINSNLNLQAHQLPVIAQAIYDNFKTESIEDIILCFRKGAAGFYGQIFRLDGAVIIDWMQKYLEEKYSIVESKIYERKREDAEIDYKAFQLRITNEREKQKAMSAEAFEEKKRRALRELEYSETRRGYTPPTEEQIVTRELHRQWIMASFDPITREKLPGYLSEQEWILSQRG